MARKIFLLLELTLLLIIVLLSSGCAVNRATATLDPTADLTSIKSLYIAPLQDEWGTDLLIANKFRTMGYLVTTGNDRPADFDALVTYEEKWMWDITMYLLELTITIRDPKNDFPWAWGNSYHTSLTRLSAEKMVDEVITNMFKEVQNGK